MKNKLIKTTMLSKTTQKIILKLPCLVSYIKCTEKVNLSPMGELYNEILLEENQVKDMVIIL